MFLRAVPYKVGILKNIFSENKKIRFFDNFTLENPLKVNFMQFLSRNCKIYTEKNGDREIGIDYWNFSKKMLRLTLSK